MSALTKAEIAEHLCANGFSKKDSRDMADKFFELIRSALEVGETVRFSGFGGFGLKDKAKRPGRNPKTGRDAVISSRRVVTFKASQKLKMRIEREVTPETIRRLAKDQGRASNEADSNH